MTASTEPSGGGLVLTKTSAYNYAGLLAGQIDEKGLTTSYTYVNGGRSVQTNFPNGSQSIKTHYHDGTPYKVTGNAQVDEWINPGVNSDGTTTEMDYFGSNSGIRWESIQRDWLGRTIADTVPAYGGGSSVKQSYYNTLGQLYKTTQTGMSATLYQYDSMGQLQYTWLDYNNNGQLDLGGPDRVTETRSQVMVDSNNVWWNQTQTFVFPQGSSTPTLKLDVRQRLVPYGSTQTDFTNGVEITETDSYDYYGNLTKEVVNSNPTTGVVTDTTTLPNSTTPKITTKYNRLLVSSQTAQGIVTTYQYDALDRETSEIDPRKGTSYTSYFTSSSQNGQLGQVSSKTDAAGKTTGFAYDPADGRSAVANRPARQYGLSRL